MKEINYIVQNVSPTSLIIIDELGRGKYLIHHNQMKIFYFALDGRLKSRI